MKWTPGCVALLVLGGCGGAAAPVRPQADPVKTVTVERIAPGGYQHGCLAGETLWLARGLVLEQWRAGDGRLLSTLVGSVRLTDRPLPVDAMACTPARVVLGLGRAAVGVEAGAVAWEAARGAGPTGWPTPGDPAPGMWANSLADGRVVQLGADLRVLRGLQITEQRKTPAGLRGSTFDGQTLFGVGDSGLWRWIIGRRGALEVLLPPATPLPLLGAFRDGEYLWLRRGDDRVAPYRVRGGQAQQVRAAGAMPAAPLKAVLPLGSGWVRVDEKGGLGFERDAARWEISGLGKISAIAPVPGGVLVADQVAVYLLALEGGSPRLQPVLRTGSPTVNIYVTGAQAVLVGRDYGVVVARLSP